jgi:hypothetical protein
MSLPHLRIALAHLVGIARRALGVRVSLSDQPGDLCKWIAPAVGSEIVAWHRFALIQLGSWPLIVSSKWMFDYIAFLGDLDSL